jgi:hypothetical protein
MHSAAVGVNVLQGRTVVDEFGGDARAVIVRA